MVKDDECEGDDFLWQQEIDSAKPLNSKKKVQELQSKEILISDKNDATNSLIDNNFVQNSDNYLLEGDLTNMDKASAKKLKTGNYPIEVTLDLHGRTAQNAFDILCQFIIEAYQMKKRCILVITGKGSLGKGIIREKLPKWLNSSIIAKYILAYNYAVTKHGGTGAFYVLLKKNKES